MWTAVLAGSLCFRNEDRSLPLGLGSYAGDKDPPCTRGLAHLSRACRLRGSPGLAMMKSTMIVTAETGTAALAAA